ncbi:hypothetical protein FA95DRAFT_1608402 [Auriscalpium vulgare]|uniref:Uncharacterized protein n=1 Tax=Auriscalpium vulgare TaxID=40419 RepID=A0ACB8RLP2_9AGAM|nr:hypothetical protein FA95DRAFT_1608402 [Auriscalpium vulgare]
MSRRLPTELLILIIGFTPVEALYALRPANRALRALATPEAFRAVGCTGTVKSTAGMLNLLASELRVHVEEVHYCDWYATKESETTDLSPEQGDEELLRINLGSALALLHTLPSLHTLSLTFAPIHDGNPLPAHVELQFALFEMIAKLSPAPALRTFVLESLLPFPDFPGTDPRFLSIMDSLRGLTITAASESIEGAISQDPITAFFTASLPPVLDAPRRTLTSLTLVYDEDAGLPRIVLGGLHYPQLERLALTSVLFDEYTGVEAFIIAHAATLLYLDLAQCKIALEESTFVPPRTWTHIYGAFSERLERLTHLEVIDEAESVDEGTDHESGVSFKGRPIRYMEWFWNVGWRSWFEEDQEFSEDEDEGMGEDSGAGSGVVRMTPAIQAVAGDEDALDAFIKVVRERAASRTE